MKLIFAFLGILSVTAVTSRGVILSNVQHVTAPYVTASKLWFVQKVTFNFVDRLVSELRTPSDAFATLLPPFPDPITIEPDLLPICLPLDFLDPKLTIVGSAEIMAPLEIEGLSHISDELVIAPGIGRVNASWHFSLPSVSATTNEYSIDIEILEGTEETLLHKLLGSGAIDASVESVFLNMDASLRVPVNPSLPVGLPILALDLGFQNLAIEGGDATIDDDPVVWEELTAYLRELFDTIWNDESKVVITEAIRCSVDHVINECTVLQIPAGDCLKLEINPACLEPLMPDPRPFTGFSESFAICDVPTTEPPTTIEPTTTTPCEGCTTEDPPTTTPPTTTPPTTTLSTTPPTTTTTPPTSDSSTEESTTTEPEVTTSSGFSFAANAFVVPLVLVNFLR